MTSNCSFICCHQCKTKGTQGLQPSHSLCIPFNSRFVFLSVSRDALSHSTAEAEGKEEKQGHEEKQLEQQAYIGNDQKESTIVTIKQEAVSTNTPSLLSSPSSFALSSSLVPSSSLFPSSYIPTRGAVTLFEENQLMAEKLLQLEQQLSEREKMLQTLQGNVSQQEEKETQQRNEIAQLRARLGKVVSEGARQNTQSPLVYFS